MLSSRDTVVKMHKYCGRVERRKAQGTAPAETCRCGKGVHRIAKAGYFGEIKPEGRD